MADHTTLNPGAGGAVVATDEIGGVHYQRIKVTFGPDGQASDAANNNPLPVIEKDVRDIYRLVVPPQAVGANKVYLDLFNASGSGKTLKVLSAFAFPNLDTAVTGTLGVRLHLTRTTAIGTGGAGVTAEETNLANGSLSKLNPGSPALPAGITARIGPTGGATAGAILSLRQVFTEETNAGSAIAAALGAEFIRNEGAEASVPEGTGLRFVQGAVASVGSIAFEITFALE